MGRQDGRRPRTTFLHRFHDSADGFFGSAPRVDPHAGRARRISQGRPGPLVAELVAELVQRHVAQLKAQLLGPHPTPLESLLADQIAIIWLATMHAETQAASPAGGSLQLAAFRLRCAESALRRHLSTVKPWPRSAPSYRWSWRRRTRPDCSAKRRSGPEPSGLSRGCRDYAGQCPHSGHDVQRRSSVTSRVAHFGSRDMPVHSVLTYVSGTGPPSSRSCRPASWRLSRDSSSGSWTS
jgi:hypothetical protein